MSRDRKEYLKAYYQAHKEELKAYNQAHKEELKAYKKAYYQAHKEEAKAYKQAHKEELKAYNKSYKQAHKEELKAYNKSYKQAHKEEAKAYQQADVNGKGETKHSIRCKSRYYLKKYGTNIPGYQIHHCCTYTEAYKFIYCNKEMHKLIHAYLKQHNIDADSDHYEYIKHLLDESVVKYGIE